MSSSLMLFLFCSCFPSLVFAFRFIECSWGNVSLLGKSKSFRELVGDFRVVDVSLILTELCDGFDTLTDEVVDCERCCDGQEVWEDSSGVVVGDSECFNGDSSSSISNGVLRDDLMMDVATDV